MKLAFKKRSINTMDDFNITFFEACELLNRSKRSISRYIRRGLLHPQKIKSKQGALEYRFSKADIEAFFDNGSQILELNDTDEVYQIFEFNNKEAGKEKKTYKKYNKKICIIK